MLCVLVKMYLFPPLLLTSLNQFYVKIMNMTKLIDVTYVTCNGGHNVTQQMQIFTSLVDVRPDGNTCILAMLQKCMLMADNNLYLNNSNNIYLLNLNFQMINSSELSSMNPLKLIL